MDLPIIKLLKRREYQDLAKFQDMVVTGLYQADSRIVLHGGTAIWRCFSGSRLSYDIDAYVSSKKELKELKGSILSVATAQGVRVEKIKDTRNLIFMAFSFEGAYLKVEMNYAKKGLHPVAMRFEKVDGTYTEVLALSAEELILEKMAAYSDRRFIRDIYDMYILSDYVKDTRSIRGKVLAFTDRIEKPVNEKDLAALIYAGPVPSFRNMVEHIRGRFS